MVDRDNALLKCTTADLRRIAFGETAGTPACLGCLEEQGNQYAHDTVYAGLMGCLVDEDELDPEERKERKSMIDAAKHVLLRRGVVISADSPDKGVQSLVGIATENAARTIRTLTPKAQHDVVSRLPDPTRRQLRWHAVPEQNINVAEPPKKKTKHGAGRSLHPNPHPKTRRSPRSRRTTRKKV